MIYLDNNATTRMDPRVFETMRPYFLDHYANAGSIHEMGVMAATAIEDAQRTIAGVIGARAGDIVFTSGATESNNLAIMGSRPKGHIITTAIEHKSVLDVVGQTDDYTILPVDGLGRVDPDAIRRAIKPNTRMVSVMHANNEIGTIQPINEIGTICYEYDILFHVDATQTIGHVDLKVNEARIDLLSFSSHKHHGPKGVGVLYVRSSTTIDPMIHGGGHQEGRRSGTLNVAGIVGAADALRLCGSDDTTHRLRNALWRQISENIELVRLNGAPLHDGRLPNNLNFCVDGIDTHTLIECMPDIAFSAGSACSATSRHPSHVLKAIGLRDEQISASMRLGVSRFTTNEEVAWAASRFIETIARIRATIS